MSLFRMQVLDLLSSCERRRGGGLPATRSRHDLHVRVVLIAVLTALVPDHGFAEQLSGRVDTHVQNGGAPATAVVYAESLDQPAPTRPATFTVAQKNKSFAPRVVGVPTGSSINFPNEDAIFHNVFSLSPPQPFDLGLYRSGASRTRTFAQAAVYHLFCNIHPQMAAFVVVVPSPWVTTTAPDGSWRLDLPPGRYRITALSERASPASIDVTVGQQAAHPPVLNLEETKSAQTQHLNKFGKPYAASAYKDR
jgi:plastocyanin